MEIGLQANKSILMPGSCTEISTSLPVNFIDSPLAEWKLLFNREIISSARAQFSLGNKPKSLWCLNTLISCEIEMMLQRPVREIIIGESRLTPSKHELTVVWQFSGGTRRKLSLETYFPDLVLFISSQTTNGELPCSSSDSITCYAEMRLFLLLSIHRDAEEC